MIKYINNHLGPIFIDNLKQWRDCQQGNFAIISGFVAIALLAATGLSVDTMRAKNVRYDLQAALDSAALAGVITSSNTGVSATQIEAAGIANFNQYFDTYDSDTAVNFITVDYVAGQKQVTATGELNLSTNFFSVFGKDTIKIGASAIAVGQQGSNKPRDIALMLDVSGSMAGDRLDALKDAVRVFAGETIGVGNVSTTDRIALAPFSTSVNAGPYASNLTASVSGSGCVGERAGIEAFTDAFVPSIMFDVNGEFIISNDENGDIYREGYFRSFPPNPGLEEIDTSTLCSSSTIVPLTGSYNSLITAVDNFAAEGLTAGHIGIAFSWYLISEEWAAHWPTGSKPAPQATTDKVAVLMSDGQFNSYYQNANGEPNVQGQTLCDNMKAENVEIYAVSFDFDGDSEDLMRNCVSNSDFFFDANSNDELIQAFRDISSNINQGNVRLTR